MEAMSTYSSGVAVFYRSAENFSVEALQTYRANVVIFQLASGDRRGFIVGCYLAPDDASTIYDIVADIRKRPRGSELLVVGNFNNNMDAPEAWEWDKGIATALEEEVREDMIGNFLPRHKPWLKDGCTWAMHQGDRKVRSWTNYILGTDSCLFQNIAVRETRHNMDQYLVLGCLIRAAHATHSCYLGKSTRFPIIPLATLEKSDRMSAELQRAIPRPTWRERHRQYWISPETWSMIDTRIEARQWRDQQSSRSLVRAIKVELQGDRCRWVTKAGSAVEFLLASNLLLICKA